MEEASREGLATLCLRDRSGSPCLRSELNVGVCLYVLSSSLSAKHAMMMKSSPDPAVGSSRLAYLLIRSVRSIGERRRAAVSRTPLAS